MIMTTANVRKKRRYRIARVSTVTVPAEIPRRNNTLYMLLTFLTAAGVLSGAYGCYAGGAGNIPDMITAHGGDGFVGTFADSFLLMAAYILICFFGGFSSAGKPAAYLLCIFRGTGAGFLSACLFSQGFSGMDMEAVLDILPFEAMSVAIVIFAARENIRLSDLTEKRTFGGADKAVEAGDDHGDLPLYLKKFAVITAAAAGAAAIDGLISMAAQML